MPAHGQEIWRATHEQKLLLRAALSEDAQAARGAWGAWHGCADFARLDDGSRRLLPLLYFILRRHGADDAATQNLRQFYRQTWCRNNLLFRRGAEVIGRLHDAGIETMLLKGAALTQLYYKDEGVRPMSDFDVVVQQGSALAAVEVLQRAGWQPVAPLPAQFTKILHSSPFKNSAGDELDLHWHVFAERCYAQADDECWTKAIRCEFGGLQTRALHPAHQLAHICVHGAAWNEVPPVRWIADALFVINSRAPKLDWEVVGRFGSQPGLRLPLREALEYLRAEFSAPVPQSVLTKLRAQRIGRIEKSWYAARNAATAADHPAIYVLVVWRFFLRSASGGGVARAALMLPRQLQYLWGAESSWQLLAVAARRLPSRTLLSLRRWLNRTQEN